MTTKIILLLVALTTASVGQHSQTTNKKPPVTAKYAGFYSFGNNVEKEAVGSVSVYPETDTTILFYVDICRGAPSYNMGSRYDRLKIKNGKGVYYSKQDYDKMGCKWEVTINNKVLTIHTLEGCYDCGFGGGVIADHTYNRKDNIIPEYFINGEGDTIFFSKKPPQEYYEGK